MGWDGLGLDRLGLPQYRWSVGRHLFSSLLVLKTILRSTQYFSFGGGGVADPEVYNLCLISITVL